MEFLWRLFDTSDFPARWTCGRWSPGHGWLHILSDLGVWSAYFTIPVVLGYFLARRKDLPFRYIFLLFAAFIVLCGTTHLMEDRKRGIGKGDILLFLRVTGDALARTLLRSAART